MMSGAAADAMDSAWQLCLAGRYEEALKVLSAHLARVADDADAWVLAAKIFLQQRDHHRAIAAASNATRLNPRHSDGLYTLGRAHRANGTIQAAESCYRRALAIAPDNPDILVSLGVLLRAQSKAEEAIGAYRRALAVNPGHAEAANNLGNALAALGRTDEAAALHGVGKPLLAQRLKAMQNRVDQLLTTGKLDDARVLLSEALELAPNDACSWLSAGKLDCVLGRHQAGLDCVEQATCIDPDLIEAHDIARWICIAAGLHEKALHHGDRMLALSPTADILVAHQLLLPCIQSSRESIPVTRERYSQGLGLAMAGEEPLSAPRPVPDKMSFFIASHTAFYLAYHGENDRDLQCRLAQMYLKRMPDLLMDAPHCHREQRRPGRLRIGFISRFLCSHSIGATTRGLIDRLSRDRFEVFALRLMPSVDDEVTRAIRASADQTVNVDCDLALARAQLAALELDVLFYQDIGMESQSYFLAFARLAPVQCVSFGHPDTTGIPTMDYFISNDLYETPDAQSHYSEQLFLLRGLPTLAYYYKPALPRSPAAREKFGLAASETIYLCPQTLFKLHPDFDPLMKGILMRDPNAVIVLIEGAFKGWEDALRSRFERVMPSVLHRIRFVPRQAYAEFLELIAAADVILDTVHFNGMNTSLESFALGKPVVTLPAAFQRGRHTQAMYRAMGISDAIGSDAESYVDIAVRLGTDRDFARSLQSQILARNAVLFENPRVVEEFERFFLESIRRVRPTWDVSSQS